MKQIKFFCDWCKKEVHENLVHTIAYFNANPEDPIDTDIHFCDQCNEDIFNYVKAYIKEHPKKKL